MALIVPGIATLEQHAQQLSQDEEAYRPERCPHCGQGGVWRHGRYGRKADRRGGVDHRLHPVWIPRFFCRHCQRSCSSLPECIAPRRWYLWSVQQVVLWSVLCAESVHQASRRGGVSRRTVRRWRAWLVDHEREHRSGLCARFAELGRHRELSSFWCRCFQTLGLARSMVCLARDGFSIP